MGQLPFVFTKFVLAVHYHTYLHINTIKLSTPYPLRQTTTTPSCTLVSPISAQLNVFYNPKGHLIAIECPILVKS